jgi:hypothetical protein
VDGGAEIVDGVARSWMAAKAAWYFPSLAAPPRSDQEVCRWVWGAVNFSYCALSLTLSFIVALCDGATTIDWLTAPD